VSKGDVAAIQDYAKISQDMTGAAATLSKLATDGKLTPEQQKKLTDLAQKWANAAQKK
jgi:hypothetical protein